MKRPNALSPTLMSPVERRAELCRLLALGLIRLRSRNHAQLPAGTGEFPLHNPADQSGTAGANNRRDT